MSYLQIWMNAQSQTLAMVNVKTLLEVINANHALMVRSLIPHRGGVLYQRRNGIFFWVSYSKQNPLAITICIVNINMIS
jgi:hypothetical protein